MIIDSSSLIIFAKINKLDLLLKLYNKIFITKEIYNTIEQGTKINAPDVNIIKNFINNNFINVLELNKKYEKFSKDLRGIYSQLGEGESDAIALALQKEDKILIMDEAIDRKVAKLFNLKPIGSLRVLLEAYKTDAIKEVELRNNIKEMIRNKFRLGADVIDEFWTIFNKLKNKKIKNNMSRTNHRWVA